MLHLRLITPPDSTAAMIMRMPIVSVNGLTSESYMAIRIERL